MERKHHNYRQQKIEEENPRTIFVGGFASSTTQNQIRNLFSEFGAISRIKMVKNRKGGSKGYGFVVFLNESVVETVLNTPNVILNGRRLSCRPILDGNELAKMKKNIDEKRVIVTNLPSANENEFKDEIKRFFEKYGVIENFYFAKEVEFLEDKQLTLFITYKYKKSVEAVLKHNLIFNGFSLEVHRYKRPPQFMKNDEKPKSQLQFKKKNSQKGSQIQSSQKLSPKVHDNAPKKEETTLDKRNQNLEQEEIELSEQRKIEKMQRCDLKKLTIEKHLIEEVWSKEKKLNLVLSISSKINNNKKRNLRLKRMSIAAQNKRRMTYSYPESQLMNLKDQTGSLQPFDTWKQA